MSFTIFSFFIAQYNITAHAAAQSCERLFDTYTLSKAVLKNFDVSQLSAEPTAQAMATEVLAFAVKHDLPLRVVEVGPAEKRFKRLLVAIDSNQKEVMEDYVRTFNLTKSVAKTDTTTLAIEFQKEVENNYVFGAVRTGDNPYTTEGVWRWGRDNQASAVWTKNIDIDKATGIRAFGHLIGVTPAEAKNIKYFLENPAERGECKSNNCIAWITGVELGKTAKGATEIERQPLFNVLGVSRTIAHFEIARRLMHAVNERHVAIVAIVDGEKGLNSFRNAETILTAEPKIPFTNIIKGLGFPESSQVMKAISNIPDGAKIFVPIAAGASPDGVTALIQKAAQTQKGYDVHVLVNGISEATLQKGLDSTDGKFRLHSLFLGGNLRKAYAQGKVNVIPGYLSDFGRMVQDPEKPDFHYDAMIVRVAPKDENGKYSLGPNNDMIMTVLRARPNIKIIAEVNPNVPRTTGENFLTETQITQKFESHAALAGPPVVPLTDIELTIGQNLAKLIPSKSALQIGIGNIFGGLPMGMISEGKNNISIFTEMFGDPLKQMIEDKTAISAKTGFAYGSADLYKWLDGNKAVTFVETDFVNSPGRVAEIKNFHAVNTALQVTLRGDVNATHGADGKRISSPGGQVEFMSGASRSIGGKAIIAIRSTAKNGTVSAISLDTYGGNITTPHESVTHVVTEYGIAILSGKGEAERAVALIKIAHPQFRADLIVQALKRGMISRAQADEILK